jgi:hypothetical protein
MMENRVHPKTLRGVENLSMSLYVIPSSHLYLLCIYVTNLFGISFQLLSYIANRESATVK